MMTPLQSLLNTLTSTLQIYLELYLILNWPPSKKYISAEKANEDNKK